MPPKIKITKDNVIETTINLIRINGASSINARTIANALNCSTQPIFSNFSSMEELRNSVIKSVYQVYLQYLNDELSKDTYPPYKSYGMAYIHFAKQETELFKLLFMSDRTSQDLAFTEDFQTSVEMIMKATSLSQEKAKLFHLEMWAFVHGIATMFATSFCAFDWDEISKMISDVYQGLRLKHLS